MASRTRRCATWVVVLATAVGGCKTQGGATTGPEDAGAEASTVSGHYIEAGPFVALRVPGDSGPAASGIPVPASKVESTVNPKNLAPYAGPSGTIEGVVTATGDAPARRDLAIPFACGEASATYGKAFREGTGRTVADALVAVTGYEGYVPASGDVLAVKIHGCAYDRRTLAVTYGQHLEVFNTDPKETFLPVLEGAHLPASMAAIPHGDGVNLYPLEVGHYQLREDAAHPWMLADVFVLRYPTHTVTGLDGHYRITGIPAGKVKVSMYLPVIDAQLHPDVGIPNPTQEREVEVKAGETTKVDFSLAYKVPKPVPKPKVDPNRPIIK
jgi:hypothetical protein